jgi:hypothetical protein
MRVQSEKQANSRFQLERLSVISNTTPERMIDLAAISARGKRQQLPKIEWRT